MSSIFKGRHLAGATALVMILLAVQSLAFGQTSAPTSAPVMTDAPPHALGAWVFVPPVVTILLAIFFQQVIPALAIGIIVATYMDVISVAVNSEQGFGYLNALDGITKATEIHLVGAMADESHIKILIFSLTIGGMVGVLSVNGGTAAMVHGISKWAHTRQKGQLGTWFAGLLVFFDDYANAMVVGPSMKPITDRLGISRAKLAYIVDSTAAPVASIALITTWVGAEINYIDEGFKDLDTRPAFLEGVSGYGAFIASLPYRFYDILALVMVFLVAVLGRDFGPMRREEQEATDSIQSSPRLIGAMERHDEPEGSAWHAILPVLTLIVTSIGLLVAYGWPEGGFAEVELESNMPEWLQPVAYIFGATDSYNAILYGALASLTVALLVSMFSGACSLTQAVDGATDTMSRMFPTFLILVLAWSFSGAMDVLELGQVSAWYLERAEFDPTYLPLLIFVTACVTAFSTGTSWGTMGILCPAVVAISARVLGDLPEEQAQQVFYAAVGAVLAGAVFGDHCSPISDTTVLSALATECPLEKHVWTQIPYALTVAFVSVGAGYILCLQYQLHVGYCLLIAVTALFLILLLFGRRPKVA